MHRPVLLKETVQALGLKPGDTVLDATIDGGGHGKVILEQILPGGKLVGIDQDKEMLDRLILNSQFSIFKQKGNLVLANGNFRDIDRLLKFLKIESVNAALFDLGVSSHHFEESGRGFSFQKDEPLLMNMKFPPDKNDLNAEYILNNWSEKKLFETIRNFGGERYAGRIARTIVYEREKHGFETTGQLVETIREAVPPRYRHGRLHFATRTFQALRIAVNDELGALEEGLRKTWPFLNRGAKLAVISFHSLEDRIVKNFFREMAAEGKGSVLTKKPVKPAREEILENKKSRSAKLRAIEKLEN